MISQLGRALWFVVALAACAGPKPATARATSVPEPAEPATAPAVLATTPVVPSTPAATTPATRTPTAQVSHGAGAHCLYVGPDHRVVRCYWKREDCAGQVAFNTGYGLSGSQECKAVAEPYCFHSASSELCYPTAADCDRTVADMKKRDRQASGCAPRTGP